MPIKLPALIFDEQKTTEAASLLLKLNGGEMNYMKLIKLLYFIDRLAMKKWQRPITFDTYYSMKDGIVLSNVLDLSKDNTPGRIWHQSIQQIKNYSVSLMDGEVRYKRLSPADVKLITDTYNELGKMDQYELGNKTKEFKEYKKLNSTQKRMLTHYTDILSALDFTNKDIQEIEEDLLDQSQIMSLVGA